MHLFHFSAFARALMACARRKLAIGVVQRLLISGSLMLFSYASNAEDSSSPPPSQAQDADTQTLEQITLDEEATPDQAAQEQDRTYADAVQLDTIITTATKREAQLRDVPASIHAISGMQLEDSGANQLRDFLPRVPGVQQTEVLTEYNRISVRGIQSDAAAITPAATGYFVDDVPFSDPFVLHARPDIPPFDLESVEMLKGPQGTLFGASALAGALRYRLTDAQPGIWETRGYLQYQQQEDGAPVKSAGLASNMPLGNDAALRLVGTARVGGGRIDDLRSGEGDTDRGRRYGGRALFRWDAGGDWSIGLKGITQYSTAEDVPNAETTDGRLERERALRKAPTEARFNFATLDITRRLGWAELVSVTSFVDKNSQLSADNGARGFGTEDTGQPISVPSTEDIQGVIQELRLVSSAPLSGWDWLTGIYYHRYEDLSTQRVTTTEQITSLQLVLLDFEADIEAEELAAFAEVSRKLGERWQLTTGLRAYQVKTTGDVYSTGAIILATGNTENHNDANITASGINPKVALQYAFNQHASTYLSVSRGFRFGGIQIIGPSPVAPDVPETYKPDSLWSYELGVRTRWLNNRLSLDGAVFYIDWENPQMQTTTGGAVPLNVVDNIGHARSVGAELSLHYHTPIRGLQLYLAGAYTDSRSTEPYTTPSGEEARADARLPGTALHQIQAELNYAWAWGNNQFDLALAYQDQGQGVSDILQNIRTYDYHTADIRLAYENPHRFGATRLSVGVSNVTDERAVTQALVLSEENFTTMYNDTRTVDLRLSFRF